MQLRKPSFRSRMLMRYAPLLRMTLQNDSGSIAIETAMGFMLMMTMVLGILEMSMMLYTYGSLEGATREGMRYATLHGSDSTTCSGPTTGCSDPTAANVVSAVTSHAHAYVNKVTSLSVSVVYPDGSSAPNSRVQITITYPYQPMFRLPGMSHTLVVSSQGRILY